MTTIVMTAGRCRGEECAREVYALELCRAHYLRHRREGKIDLSPIRPHQASRVGVVTRLLSVRLPVELIAELRAKATAAGMSTTAFTERAIQAGLEDIP